jgi:hypothetical protein
MGEVSSPQPQPPELWGGFVIGGLNAREYARGWMLLSFGLLGL